MTASKEQCPECKRRQVRVTETPGGAIEKVCLADGCEYMHTQLDRPSRQVRGDSSACNELSSYQRMLARADTENLADRAARLSARIPELQGRSRSLAKRQLRPIRAELQRRTNLDGSEDDTSAAGDDVLHDAGRPYAGETIASESSSAGTGESYSQGGDGVTASPSGMQLSPGRKRSLAALQSEQAKRNRIAALRQYHRRAKQRTQVDDEHTRCVRIIRQIERLQRTWKADVVRFKELADAYGSMDNGTVPAMQILSQASVLERVINEIDEAKQDAGQHSAADHGAGRDSVET